MHQALSGAEPRRRAEKSRLAAGLAQSPDGAVAAELRWAGPRPARDDDATPLPSALRPPPSPLGANKQPEGAGTENGRERNLSSHWLQELSVFSAPPVGSLLPSFYW